MKLDIQERIGILSILPRNGSFLVAQTCKGLIDQLTFKDDEQEAVNLREEEGQLLWDKEKEEVREFEISNTATELIRKELIKRNESEEITVNLVPLYEKFVNGQLIVL